jgi:DNA gyrase/topoisomerase IV subunit A
VLICTVAGEEENARRELLKIEGVKEVDTTSGAYDNIAVVERESIDELIDVVVDKIRKIPSVIKTETLLGKKKGEEEIILASANSQVVCFSQKELRPLLRGRYGVKGMKLTKGDGVASITAGRDIDLLTITENGYGKKTPLEKYRKSHRGRKGVRTIITNERNGKVLAIEGVKSKDEIILASLRGKVVRIPVSHIPVYERNTQGVRLMKLKEGDKVVSVTRVTK